ncbi:MAG: hypothetical protein KJ077_17015 [Anaerolineae bacterium]|nr:hypothetical protein [Anaerolineae bacterium]
MKTPSIGIALILGLSMSLTLATITRADGPGDLDPTFGNGGKVLTDLGGNNSSISAMVLQPDGKIVAAGRSFNGSYEDTTLARYNSNGSLDPTFGSGGVVITSLNSADDQAYAIARQSDGKIIVAGSQTNGYGTDFVLARYNSNGSLDPSFGSGGIVGTHLGDYDEAYGMVVQPDGKIIIVGLTGPELSTDFVVVRYNSNGTLDSSFDTDGVVITDVGGYYDRARAVLLQPDGKIVVAGTDGFQFIVTRYTSNGSLDASFGADGIVVTTISSLESGISDIVLQPDGKIVAAGYSQSEFSFYYEFALARYNANGSLDISFDSDGIVTTATGPNESTAYGLRLQTDGKIVVAGSALIRYNSNGSLDTSFGTNGIAPTSFGSAGALTVQSDGKFVAAGQGNFTFALGRYQPSGSLDLTFDADGQVFTNLGHGEDRASAMALQSDGKIVVVGSRWRTYFTNMVAVARHHSNGSLDPTFGNGGIVGTPVSPDDSAYDVAVQDDGKIVVVGRASSENLFGTKVIVIRYNIDGTLDPTFDTDGIVSNEGLGESAAATAVGIQPDGKIVVAGYSGVYGEEDFTLVRYNPNGTLDPSFAGDGITTTPIGLDTLDQVHDLVIQSNGKIVVVGWSGYYGQENFTLARYNSNGSLDTSFGGDGIVTTPIGSNAYAEAVALQGNDKIVVVGGAHYDGSDYPDFVIVRYNSNGSLDTTFSGDGLEITDISGIGDVAYAVAVQSNNKIVVAGNSNSSDFDWIPVDFTVVRYNNDGSLDTSFDTDGIVITAFDSDYGEALAVALQPDGKIVVAGVNINDVALARYQGDPSPNTPAITVTKTANVSAAQVGQTITYTYRVTNTGSVTLTGIVANDNKLGPVTLPTTSLAPNIGTEGTLTYTVLAGNFPGPLTNTVGVTGTPASGPQVTAAAVATVTVQSGPDTQAPTFPNPALLTPTLGIILNTSRPVFDWADATDNVGVIGYTLVVTNSGGNLTLQGRASMTTTQSNFTPLVDLPDNSYTWTVRAYDAAGNIATVSPPATFVIQAAEETGFDNYLPSIIKQ